MNGQVVHFEIPFDDGDRARKFYGDTFGWTYDHMPEVDYTGVTTGPVADNGMPSDPGYIGGGMAQRNEEQKFTRPVIVINVESIDGTLKKIGELGGSTAVEKMAVMEMGFAAYFNDPEGNLMGLWEMAASAD